MQQSPGLRLLAALMLLAAIGLSAAACTAQPSEPIQPPAGAVSDANQGKADEAGEEAEEAAEAGDPEEGKTGFATCAGCHGPDGKGLPNLGKDLHNNAFLAGLSDAEAIAFLKKGRDTTDPLNTTGVAMPPKGGNPAFDDEDLANIVAYVRTLK